LTVLDENSSPVQIINLFATGVQRCVLYNPSREISHVLTQMDVCRYLYNHLYENSRVQGVADQKLSQLGYNMRFDLVHTISSRATTRDAITRLYNHAKNSALAVVKDSTGALVGNFSASDIRGLYVETLPKLSTSLFDYLAKHSSASLSPVTLSPDSTFAMALRKLVDSKVHQCWIVNELYQPIGVITTTDIIRFITTSVA